MDIKNLDLKTKRRLKSECKSLLAQASIYYAEPERYITLDFGNEIGTRTFSSVKLKEKLTKILEVLK